MFEQPTTPSKHDPKTADALARYKAILQTADLSSVSRSQFAMIFGMNANVVIDTDARTALLTSVANAIDEHNDTALATGLAMFASPHGNFTELLALEKSLQSYDLVQCTVLIESIEQMRLSSGRDLSWNDALDDVHCRMTQRNA